MSTIAAKANTTMETKKSGSMTLLIAAGIAACAVLIGLAQIF